MAQRKMRRWVSIRRNVLLVLVPSRYVHRSFVLLSPELVAQRIVPMRYRCVGEHRRLWILSTETTPCSRQELSHPLAQPLRVDDRLFEIKTEGKKRITQSLKFIVPILCLQTSSTNSIVFNNGRAENEQTLDDLLRSLRERSIHQQPKQGEETESSNQYVFDLNLLKDSPALRQRYSFPSSEDFLPSDQETSPVLSIGSRGSG
jgi:hypothetical protein